MQADELRLIRKNAGMTQGELAEALGLSIGFIGEMERGEKAVEKRTELAVRYVVERRSGELSRLVRSIANPLGPEAQALARGLSTTSGRLPITTAPQPIGGMTLEDLFDALDKRYARLGAGGPTE
jgi:transcriptional regulator with XRE-family HTH domain